MNSTKIVKNLSRGVVFLCGCFFLNNSLLANTLPIPFNYRVEPRIVKPTGKIVLSEQEYTLPLNQPIQTILPDSPPNLLHDFSISPDLNRNTGLSFDTTTGTISGIPNSNSPSTIYTIQASASGSTYSSVIYLKTMSIERVNTKLATTFTGINFIMADQNNPSGLLITNKVTQVYLGVPIPTIQTVCFGWACPWPKLLSFSYGGITNQNPGGTYSQLAGLVFQPATSTISGTPYRDISTNGNSFAESYTYTVSAEFNGQPLVGTFYLYPISQP